MRSSWIDDVNDVNVERERQKIKRETIYKRA